MFGHLFFPFGDTAFKAQATAFADTLCVGLDDLEEAFVVFGGVGVIDLLK